MKRGLLTAALMLTAGAAYSESAVSGDALVANFEPGKFGEPFSVTALMQGCEVTAELNGCSFYAEGARWVVSREAGSNAAALDAMAALPVNAPLIVVGDMISFGDITAEAVVARIETAAPDAYAGLRAAMQGAWVAQDDAQSTLLVTGSEEAAAYGGEMLSVSVLTFSDSCPGGEAVGGESVGTVIFKQEMGGDPADLPCFAVVELTPERMELSYVGRGNTLVYLRP